MIAARRSLVALLLVATACARSHDDQVVNQHPIHLVRPAVAPLSAVAQVGALIFRDTTLSASGHVACATCHDPAHAYAPGNALAVQRGGPHGTAEGSRAVLSLRYADRAANFMIGPDNGEQENVNLHDKAALAAGFTRVRKQAGAAADPAALIPQAGLFWDGRANTLEDQAMGPLFDSAEMANRDPVAVAAQIRRAPWYSRLVRIFGAAMLADPARLVDEAMFAVARYEVEDPSFHPYASRYDAYLEGRATLTAAEARGLRAFDDTARGNCAGCHIDRPSPDGRPPPFTDQQYEALGAPRNADLAVNRNAAYFDLGVCGPIRHDLATETQYCGMFRTPTLRNVATRHAFFHNGVFGTLEAVLHFYNFRDIAPDSVYPVGAAKFNDIPSRFRGNVDTIDAPLNRHRGDRPAMTDQDMRDIVAFLRTLTDQ
ncbi:MAG TPA: cytochrome c peroxidase [Gemmatimonadales bacterium]